MPIKKTSRRGFSLLELLLVLTLAPIIFFAVYSNFSVGIRLWQRLQISTPEEDRVIFKTKVQRDLGNAMHFAPIPFLGEKTEMAFACGITAAPELGGERAIGEVRYYFDESSHALMRETRDYSQVYQDKPGQIARMLQEVGAFEVFYLLFNPIDKKYEWKDVYHPENGISLPIAVRFSYSRQGAENAEQTFFLPTGGAVK